eukprot:4771389-Alexandrium_andersonii.AAC.1
MSFTLFPARAPQHVPDRVPRCSWRAPRHVTLRAPCACPNMRITAFLARALPPCERLRSPLAPCRVPRRVPWARRPMPARVLQAPEHAPDCAPCANCCASADALRMLVLSCGLRCSLRTPGHTAFRGACVRPRVCPA